MLRTQDTWDYNRGSVVAAISHARSLLDMDTGGGEFIAALPQRPPQTHTTEGYAPNVLVVSMITGIGSQALLARASQHHQSLFVVHDPPLQYKMW